MKLSPEKMLGVRRQEQPLLFLMVGTIALFQFCQILNENFSATVFLKRYGVQYLPTTFFCNSLAFLVLILGLNRVVDRTSRARLISHLLIVFAVVLAALRLLIASGIPLAYPVTYIVVKQMKYIFFIVFWTLASDIYSTRKARRIFPILGGGAVMGTIAGSIMSPGIARLAGTDNVVLCSGIGMLISYLLIGLGRRQVARLSPISFSPSEEITLGSLGKFIRRELAQRRGSSLLGYLMLLALMPGIVTPLFEYLFKYLANQAYSSEASLLGFFGIFNGSINIMILACQLLAAGGLFRRYGIVNVLMTYPCGYLLTFVGLYASFKIYTAMLGNAALEVIDAAFYKPGCQMLYNIIPAGLRGRVSAFVQGAVRRIGELAGSGLLWLLVLFIPPRGLALAGPLIVLAWIACNYRLRRAYSSILYQSLSDRHVNFAELESRELGPLMTAGAVRQLAKSLTSGTPGTALMAARLLSQSGVGEWPAMICDAMPSLDPAVQVEMVRIVGAAPSREAVPALLCVAGRLGEGILSEVAAAIRRLAPDKGVELFRKGVRSAVPALVAESILGLRAAGEEADAAGVIATLDSPDVEEARSALYLIGEIGGRGMLSQVRRFMSSEHDPLRAECARALGKLGLDMSDNAWRALLQDPHPLVRAGAIDGLAALRRLETIDLALPLLADEEYRVRAAARALIVSHGETALPRITAALSASGIFTRALLIGILDELGAKEQTLLALIDAKAADGYRAVAGMRAAEEAPQGRAREIFLLLFQNRLHEAIDEIFRALTLLLKGSRVQFILESYRDRDEAVREHALEALEEVLTPAL
ncbi:MAG: hypothetical protein NT045_00355, partial [Candidatus Aureabacteria bacterium]|nr:hypothetical protein [Candidatus Auribacterota bacterium]